MTSLQEAIDKGQGVERPFRCHEHEDNQASASVNVLKGVWYCYACAAKGTVDGKRVPKVSDLQFMLEPEVSCRVYPEAYLELFANAQGNFADRFDAPTRWSLSLGCDPLSGDATFPVRSPSGRLAGVGRRKPDPGDGPRYVYPPRWAASRSLFTAVHPGDRVLVAVEGAADSASVYAAGFSALGCYGAGLHLPQIELVMRMHPQLLVLAFDGDDAGEKANKRAWGALNRKLPIVTVWWDRYRAKDPDELEVDARRKIISETVAAAGYGQLIGDRAQYTERLHERHQRYLKEEF